MERTHTQEKSKTDPLYDRAHDFSPETNTVVKNSSLNSTQHKLA